MWPLSVLATVFLASRFAVRMSSKGRLMLNDYFLVAGLPIFFIGAGLVQSVLPFLYEQHALATNRHAGKILRRLPAAIEMLWITIYCVKFCFLAQFKFHKPPYAYVSVHLTRYYWAVVSICSASFIVTLVQPLVLCSKSETCRYFQATGTAGWEIAVTSIDILTDLLVISIPILLIYMANFTRSHTIINTSFKSLSVFSIAIATTRLALQYDRDARRIDYIVMVFFLFTEAVVALVMASISSYRTVILDKLVEWRTTRGTNVKLTTPRDLSRTALNPGSDLG
ncbi:hypothetical protein BDV96DRAFT_583699 [Lophiotrema nucula]|uniref:Integral membrane protein n=1 Tax=Lophiotrema nucula TaxID=690887 RepID=A0A6A5YXE9_9PLEO|nr:hypothetical protein BDV96DRAFT_583699 [Lophiotrema nucula]